MSFIQNGLTSFTWPRVVIENISVNQNLIQVASTFGVFVGQTVFLTNGLLRSDPLIVVRVWDSNYFTVGLKDATNEFRPVNLSAFNGGSAEAPEQDRVYPKGTEPQRMVFAEEPILAYRTVAVDRTGAYADSQQSMLNDVPLETRFIYDQQLNVIQIREFASDPAIGDKVLATNLDYGTSLEVVRISYNYDIADSDDVN